MCFSSKPKVPKTNPEQLRAPEPVMAEEPKGVELGDEDSEFKENIGTEGLKVEKTKTTGEGTQRSQASDTGAKSATKPRGSIRRALK
ncbi:DUF5476 domain-containing protein [Pseudomonas sp.]|uniref:DUF5476 domain-containing protein n=1 Tax=Pseudomonas sp. TaxID=306 RepID=UPI00260DEAB9|nr:DUF5476 domain-containing protein [Pseudomonas sp.]